MNDYGLDTIDYVCISGLVILGIVIVWANLYLINMPNKMEIRITPNNNIKYANIPIVDRCDIPTQAN